ncbi:hypothetical protein DSO57_1004790 [Entomophthora muscae]|uniref:Uncharacterized protein n=1 Tax=Entomophthora muscae TaxID=34485 RepID=A0ACC2UV25_9FUNG|nr:hypothetical protein DSO57_1004790 [Entomophthora muscae]
MPVSAIVLNERIQEARMHVFFDKFDSSNLSELSGFNSFGWTIPGRYSKADQLSDWVNTIPQGTYPVPKHKWFSVVKSVCENYIETWYRPKVSSFYLGELTKLSSKKTCCTGNCSFSLETWNMSIKLEILSPYEDDTLSPQSHCHPNPGKFTNILNPRLSSKATCKKTELESFGSSHYSGKSRILATE